jgi:hypothetical protein
MKFFLVCLLSTIVLISGCRKNLNDDTSELKKGTISKLNYIWKVAYEKKFGSDVIDANYLTNDFINLNSKNLYCDGNNLWLNTLDGLVGFDANTGAQLNVASYCNLNGRGISTFSSIAKTVCGSDIYFYNLKTKQNFFQLQNTNTSTAFFSGKEKIFYQVYKNNQLCIVRAKNNNIIDTIIKINYGTNNLRTIVLREEQLSNNDSILIVLTKSTDLTNVSKLDLICYNLKDKSIYFNIPNLNTESGTNYDYISNTFENDHFYFQLPSKLVCIDLLNKSKRWEFAESGAVFNSNVPLAISNDVITTTSIGRNRIGINKTNGSKLWIYETGFTSGKIISNQSHFFYSNNGSFFGVNNLTGNFDLRIGIDGSTSPFPRYLEINSSGNRLFYYDAKYLYCFDISDF